MATTYELTYTDIVASSGCISATRTVTAGSTDIPAGTVLGKVTASGKYKPYASSAEDGTQNAKAVLLQTVKGVSGDVKAPVLLCGLVRRGGLTGLDSTSEASLASCSIHMDTENLG